MNFHPCTNVQCPVENFGTSSNSGELGHFRDAEALRHSAGGVRPHLARHADEVTSPSGEARSVLDPLDRISEILFGLIMALTFTGTLSVATAGREDVRTMLIGALGCNIAWGLVDGVLYVIALVVQRHRGWLILRKVHRAEPEQARGLIAGALPPVVASVFRGTDPDSVRERLAALPATSPRLLPTVRDLQGGVAVFLLVFLVTLPVAVPFLFIHEAHWALRVSNAIALLLLFACGFRLGRYMGGHPLRLGLGVTVIGLVLVAATIALGG